MLKIEHIFKTFNAGTVNEKRAISDLCLTLEDGDFATIVGSNGAGKSTLIRLIGNAIEPDAGIIRYFGEELYQNEKEIRRNISMVYDRVNFNVELTGNKLAKEIKKFEQFFDMGDFQKYMSTFGLDGNKRIRFYSRGMRKMYMLTIALARKPKLLVMDEPTSEVDEETGKLMKRVITEYREQNGLTVLFSTHHNDEMNNFADRVILMKEGELA